MTTLDEDEWNKKLRSMGLTEDAGYAAAKRLRFRHHANFAFNILLSLGLVSIPLFEVFMGNSLLLKSEFLNVVQVLLAVALLVYSAVFGVAGYDRRADLLEERSDKIKRIRDGIKLFHEIDETARLAAAKNALDEYSNLIETSESHEECDYVLARRDRWKKEREKKQVLTAAAKTSDECTQLDHGEKTPAWRRPVWTSLLVYYAIPLVLAILEIIVGTGMTFKMVADCLPALVRACATTTTLCPASVPPSKQSPQSPR